MTQSETIHALRRAARSADAIVQCRQWIAREPWNAEAAHLLGLLLSQSGDVAEALDWLKKSVALTPGNQRYRGNLVGVMSGAGRADEAERAARDGVQFDLASAEAH